MKIRRRNEKELTAAIDRGRRLLATRQEQEAFEYLQVAVQRFPKDPEIRLLYASILLAFQLDEVAGEAAKAVELAPNDPVILVRAAHLLLNRGDVEAARSCAARANDLVQPGFVLMSALVNLNGRLAALDGEDDLAEENLRSAMENEPSYSSFAVELARFLARRDRVPEAVAVINEALKHARDKDHLECVRSEIEAEAS
jgi:Flp pilus assembly protein TadD